MLYDLHDKDCERRVACRTAHSAMAGPRCSPAHADTKHYYYADAQGTVLAKTDAQGNIVARYDYKPHGAPMPSSQALGPAGYTGHVNDAETGLVSCRHGTTIRWSGDS